MRRPRVLTLIRNAKLVDWQIEQPGSLLIKDGQIIGLGTVTAFDALIEEANVIDAKGCTLMPAFIDLHVHFRDPGLTYKEDLQTGSMAALAGGYTTVNLMANTKPVCDTATKQAEIMHRAKELDLIDVYQAQAVTCAMQGEELTDFASSLGKLLSDDGKGIKSSTLMAKALQTAKMTGKLIQVHEENSDYAPDVTGLAEETMLARDIQLAKQTDAELYLCHMSTAKAMEQIRTAKAEGVKLIVEVTPHHLALADNPYKVHPPIRYDNDRQALIAGIKSGLVDIIGTDHAPHSLEDKEKGAPGLVGLETAFSVLYTTLVKENGISLKTLSQLLSHKGAEILGLNKGKLLPSNAADLVLVDLEKKRIIEPNEFQSKSKNTPFAHKEYQGEILWTMRAGQIKYRKDGQK